MSTLKVSLIKSGKDEIPDITFAKKHYSRVCINAGRHVKEKKYWKRKGEAVIINY